MTEEGKAGFLEAWIYPGDSILLPQSSQRTKKLNYVAGKEVHPIRKDREELILYLHRKFWDGFFKSKENSTQFIAMRCS